MKPDIKSGWGRAGLRHANAFPFFHSGRRASAPRFDLRPQCAAAAGLVGADRLAQNSKHPTVQQWLLRPPRWTFHPTPTWASWLNAVEGFFAVLTKRRLKHGFFRSVADLQAINRLLDDHNAPDPKPFQWVANPD